MLSVLNSWGGRVSARIGGEATNLVMLGAKIPIQVEYCRTADLRPSSAGIYLGQGQEVPTSDVTFLHALILLDPTDPLL